MISKLLPTVITGKRCLGDKPKYQVIMATRIHTFTTIFNILYLRIIVSIPILLWIRLNVSLSHIVGGSAGNVHKCQGAAAVRYLKKMQIRECITANRDYVEVPT